jgi:hypothetical protein
MYKVMYWDKSEVHSEHKNLKDAKRVCRKLGHTGKNNYGLKGYPPVAFVADKDNYLVYNPRFKKDN